MNNHKRYWFPAKTVGMGWGWGLPVRWQGWVVFVVCFGSIAGASISLAPGDGRAFSLFLVIAMTALIAICAWKGEPQDSPRL
jgi:hypothetical protein